MLVLNDFNTSVERALGEINPRWRNYPGLVVCGTHAPHDVNYLLENIQEARMSGLPFLGICFGHQLAAIEYAKNVLHIQDATSEEFGQGTLIVKKLDALNVGLRDGETYWNNYQVDPDFQWQQQKNFFTTQYHPEYQSRKGSPHPLLVEFLNFARSYAKNN